jgi:hypothetical protein
MSLPIDEAIAQANGNMSDRQKIEVLREALSGLLGDERLETALWGDLPDDAIGSITTRLGNIRAARAVLAATEKD